MERTFGRYRLVRHLATGGMGEVWLADAAGAAGFSKRVVIKTLRAELTADPRLVDQFVAEGQLLEQLDHPNIAQILDLGHADDTWFLAMEYVEGFDLRDLLRALPTPNVGEVAALSVLAAATRALEHAATRTGPDGAPLALVHHDVTPSNLMVRRDGHVKLVDFGVARSAMRAHLEPGALRGKLPYLAPEQVRSPNDLDPRVDLFALGLIAYELLEGRRALDVADPSGLEAAWQNLPERLERLTVPEPTAALVRRLSALDRDRRPADASEASSAVRERLGGLGVADPERALAEVLAPGFDRLEAAAQGFNQTLSALLGPQGAADGGTVSLPGVAGFAPVAQAASPGEDPAAEAAPPADARAPVAAPVLEAPSPAPEPEVAPEARPADTPGAPPDDGGPARWTLIAAALLVIVGAAVWVGRGEGPGGGAADVAGGAVSPAPAQDILVAARAPVDPDSAASPVGTADTVGSAPAPRAAAVPTESGSPESPDAPAAADASEDDAAIRGVGGSGLVDTRPRAPSDARSSGGTSSGGAPSRGAPSRGTPSKSDAEGARAGDGATRRPPGSARPPRRKPTSRSTKEEGTLVFRVLPVDAEVRVAGKRIRQRPADGVYRLKLPAGRHAITVRDAASGRRVTRTETVVGGRERTAPGFKVLELP